MLDAIQNCIGGVVVDELKTTYTRGWSYLVVSGQMPSQLAAALTQISST